jgi:hypothetical protein
VVLAAAAALFACAHPARAAATDPPPPISIVIDDGLSTSDSGNTLLPVVFGTGESVSTADAALLRLALTLAHAEGVAVVDDPSVLLGILLQNGEPVSTSDLVNLLLGIRLSDGETVTGTDVASFLLGIRLSNGEAVSVADAASLLLGIKQTTTEPVGVGDEIAVQVLPGAPGPPSNVVAAAGDSSAAVSWLPPVKDGGAAISGYTVTPHDVTTGSDGQPVGAVGTSASVTGLANGDAYTFTVTASNSTGPGRPSAPSASVTPQGGSAPPVATAGNVPSGGTVTGGGGDSSAAPLGAAVTTPTGGTITIVTAPPSGSPPSGYEFAGQQVEISAPPESAAAPLSLTFTIDGSVLGTGSPSHVQVFRDGVPVADCADSSGKANPDPCVASRTPTPDGGVTLVVLSSHASSWNFGFVAAPVVSAGGPYTTDEGASLALHGSATNAAGLAMTFSWDLGGGAGATGASPTIVAGDGPATQTVTLTACVTNGPCASDTTTITIANVPPTATLTAAPSPVNEGGTFTLTAHVTDPSAADVAAGFAYQFDCGGGTLVPATGPSTTCPAVDDPGVTARAQVTDKDGGSTLAALAVPIRNVAPTVTITSPAPGSVVFVGSPVSLAASFTDAGVHDTHTASFAIAGSSVPATVAEAGGSGTAGATWTPAAAGIDTLTASVTDNGGATGTASQSLIVVDPFGFTAGLGWLGPAGNRLLFTFEAHYPRGATTPSGLVIVQGRGVVFHATSLAWLVVSGKTATLQGTGVANGAAGYSFRLQAVDGRPNQFAIRIWKTSTGAVLLDTGAPAPLGGGNVTVGG